MFDSDVFHSWLSVLLGGLLFAVLFGFVGMMSDLVFGGEMQITSRSLSLGVLAFVGYVGVASLIRLKRL